jgi:hypothetical protein
MQSPVRKKEVSPMTTGAMGSVLTDDLLARCAERAPKYDEENKFSRRTLTNSRRQGI